jgi:hypothetical protein
MSHIDTDGAKVFALWENQGLTRRQRLRRRSYTQLQAVKYRSKGGTVRVNRVTSKVKGARNAHQDYD